MKMNVYVGMLLALLVSGSVTNADFLSKQEAKNLNSYLSGHRLVADAMLLGAADETVHDTFYSEFYLDRWYTRLHIRDLRASKNLKSSVLNIVYYTDGSAVHLPFGCSYMIRLFDKHGNFLYGGLTEKMPMTPHADNRNWAGYISYSFPINSRDLKEAKYVEFGYYGSQLSQLPQN